METVKFDVGLINDYSADQNDEFAIMELQFLSDGYNTHKIPISTEILMRDAKTILGKFIVAKYNRWTNDVMGHETDEAIVGYIPNNAQITFRESENGTFACVDGVISKLYAPDVYKLYKQHNQRAVSVEMTLDWVNNDPRTNQIEGLRITGVTLLGLTYDPSCALASSKIVQFSAEDCNQFYDNLQAEQFQEFTAKRKAKMAGKTYKVNTSELKSSDWGSVDKAKLRDTIMQASNRARLVKAVYAIVEAGWEEAPSEKLKYPLMQLVGDTFYYNRYALSSALAYAKQNNETAVISKIKKLYKKFDLDDTGKGEEQTMSDKKLKFGTEEFQAELEKKLKEHEKAECKCEHIGKDKVTYSCNGKKFTVDTDFDDDCEDEKECKCAVKWETKAEMGKDEKKPEEKSKEDKAKMSLDANADPAALVELLKKETQRNQQLAEELEKRDNIIMNYEAELSDLKQFKEEAMADQKKKTVETVMSEIEGMVSQKEFEDLKKEGEDCKCEALTAWANKAKAKAFESAKDKKPNGVWKMAAPMQQTSKQGSIWDRI